MSSVFCSHMHTYTRTGNEEYNDTSKKEKERKKEKNLLFAHRETAAIEACYYFFCVRKHTYSFVSLF